MRLVATTNLIVSEIKIGAGELYTGPDHLIDELISKGYLRQDISSAVTEPVELPVSGFTVSGSLVVEQDKPKRGRKKKEVV